MTTLSLPVACMSVLAIAGSALAGPSITNLGSVNGRLVLPTGISADGTTVVGNTADVLNTRPVRWTAATGAVDIGPPDQSSYAYAGAANADGSVIVGFDTGPGGATPVGSRWTASNGYQALPLPPGASNAYANGVNADGSVVVGHAGIGTAFRAYRWTSGSGYQLLPVAAGYTGEWGTGVSADGSVVVGNHTASNGFSDQAFRYTASAGYQNLGIQQGFGRSTARAVSGDGNTVVGLSQAIGSSITGAFRWTAETGLVPLFFDAESSSYATGVTFDGSRIVGSSVLNGNQIAVMWTSTLGNLDLNTYLPTLGINLTGWNLQSVQGISADGTILTGSGTFNGEEAGWVVSTVPAPSAAPLLALGGLLASRRRRRHIALSPFFPSHVTQTLVLTLEGHFAMNARSALASACLLVGLSTPALASPITYTFSFTASGSLGSRTFSNKPISISMAADTTTVTVIPPPGPANFNHGTTTVSVAGLSVATVTSFLQIYTNFNSFGLSNNNFSILDFAGLASSINAWDLRSSIGPLTPPFVSQNWSGASPYIVTDAGALSITVGSASQWRFVAAVPAPGTAGVLGLAGMMAARRRRRA